MDRLAKLGNKIVKIISIDVASFDVKLKYANGKVITVGLEEIFQRPRELAAEVLAGGMFEKCFVESGALAWPNGLELCPDALYRMARPTTKKRKLAA